MTEVLPVRALYHEEIVKYNRLLSEYCTKGNLTLLSFAIFSDRRSGGRREDLEDKQKKVVYFLIVFIVFII